MNKTSPTQPTVVVIGSINYDILMKQERLPKVGETILIEDIKLGGGGKGANQAVQVAKFDLPVSLLGAVGDDVFGKLLLQELSSYNVDTSLMSVKENTTSGLGIVNYVADGSLLSNVYPGANNLVTIRDVDSHLETIKKSSMVILQTELPVETVEYAVMVAKKHNIKIMYNAAPVKALKEEVIEAIDYFIMNESEAEYYLHDVLDSYEKTIKLGKEFQKKYNNTTIITLGPKGSVLINENHSIVIDPIDVKVVETTGAGDSFIGALAVMVCEGKDIVTSCKVATTASSLTIQKPGGQKSMPTLQEVKELYTITYKENL